jgi:carboxymethylenebutenolidase
VKPILLLLLAVGVADAAPGPQDPHAGHDHAATPAPGTSPAVTLDDSLPPSEERAQFALIGSPRHGEYVDVRVPGSQHAIRTFVAYPERRDKAPVVVVIHEIHGLSDWIRSVADQLAEDGFIALAPDLVSGKGPGGGGTDSVADRDAVVGLVRGLTPEEATARLDAVRAYGLALPAASGTSATLGFCWGGARSFAYAAQTGLDAAVVYYGTAPELRQLASIRAPVLGLYGGDDARVNASIEPTVAEMKRLGKVYEPEIYAGAGHGFLRNQSDRDGANLAGTQKAWPRTLAFLRQYLER